MFRKLLASVGIGSAKIETQIHTPSVMPGGSLTGEVFIQGGDVEQDIEALYLYLGTRYRREFDDNEYFENCTLVKYPLTQRFRLTPGQQQRIPFNIQIPLDVPLSMGKEPVFIRTDLEIMGGADAGDVDPIKVMPHPAQEAVLNAIQRLGFQLYKVDNEYNSRWRGSYPFVQEFEFKPYGYNRASLKELEVIFRLHQNGLELFLELDKRLQGWGILFGDFDLNERYAVVNLSFADIQNTDLSALIDRTIQQRVRR